MKSVVERRIFASIAINPILDKVRIIINRRYNSDTTDSDYTYAMYVDGRLLVSVEVIVNGYSDLPRTDRLCIV